MRTRTLVIAVFLAAASTLPARVSAQTREHLQMNADLRMLQEQVGKLQVMTNQIADALRTVNKRLDDQGASTQKTFADLQNLINTLATSVDAVRAKLDDNTVRVQELKQELPALRSGFSMMAEQLNTLVGLLQPPVNSAGGPPGPGGGPGTPGGASSGPLGSVRLPDSPNAIFEGAMNDYMSNHLDNAVDGFTEYLQKYPDAANAAQAQFQVGMAYYQKANFKDAFAAYGKVIANYKNAGEVVQDAYYQQGLCQIELNQKVEARRTFQEIVQKFPGSTKALLAQQKLASLSSAH